MTPRPQDMDAISSWQASATPCRLVFATDYGLPIAAVNVTFSVYSRTSSRWAEVKFNLDPDNWHACGLTNGLQMYVDICT